MPTIKLFGGMSPMIDSTLLKPEFSEYAKNTRLWNGTLRAYKTNLKIGDCKTLAINAAGCCEKPCTVRSGLCTEHNTIIAEGGRLIHEDGSPVGLPRPEKPTVVVNNEGKDTAAFMISRVNDYGEESQRSEPTQLVKVGADSVITITGQGVMRVYAYVSSEDGGAMTPQDFMDEEDNLMMIGEFEGDVASFKWDVSTFSVSSDGYDTNDWCMPENICCITMDEEGFYAIFSGKDVFISERHLPHAYPRRNRITLDHEVKQLIPYYDVFFALTDGEPYIIRKPQITSGAYMGGIDVNYLRYISKQPPVGLATRTDFGIAYPTIHGIIGLTPTAPNGLTLLTKTLHNRDTWKKYIPDITAWHDGIIYGWNKDRGFAFDMPDNNFGEHELQKFIELDGGITAAQASNDAELYVANDVLSKFDQGDSYLEALWHSKWFVEKGKRVFTAAKIDGENVEGVIFELYERSIGLVYKHVLTDNKIFRLPQVRGIEYQVRLTLPKSNKEISVRYVAVMPSIYDFTKE